MGKKIVVMDEELVAFALERCAGDVQLGRYAVSRSRNITAAKTMVDYIVKVKRLQEALEKARDE